MTTLNSGYTKHCVKRMKQRAICEQMVELVLEHGSCHQHAGADIYCFDKSTWQRIQSNRPCRKQLLDKLRSCYVVVANGKLLTTGHRIARFKRDIH